MQFAGGNYNNSSSELTHPVRWCLLILFSNIATRGTRIDFGLRSDFRLNKCYP